MNPRHQALFGPRTSAERNFGLQTNAAIAGANAI